MLQRHSVPPPGEQLRVELVPLLVFWQIKVSPILRKYSILASLDMIAIWTCGEQFGIHKQALVGQYVRVEENRTIFFTDHRTHLTPVASIV